MYLNVLLLTKLYFKQHVQWIIKDEEHGDTIVNIHVCPLQGGRGEVKALCVVLIVKYLSEMLNLK